MGSTIDYKIDGDTALAARCSVAKGDIVFNPQAHQRLVDMLAADPHAQLITEDPLGRSPSEADPFANIPASQGIPPVQEDVAQTPENVIQQARDLLAVCFRGEMTLDAVGANRRNRPHSPETPGTETPRMLSLRIRRENSLSKVKLAHLSVLMKLAPPKAYVKMVVTIELSGNAPLLEGTHRRTDFFDPSKRQEKVIGQRQLSSLAPAEAPRGLSARNPRSVRGSGAVIVEPETRLKRGSNCGLEYGQSY